MEAGGADERIDWATIRVLRVAVVAGFGGLAVAELLLRLAGLPTGATHRARDAYDLDGEAPGPYRPGARIDLAWPPETAYLATFNSWGMRGAEPRTADAPRILALGDSQTFGLGVQDDESWPARLDQNLAAAGHPHPVLNLASPHLLIDDEIRYLEEVLPRYRPAVVVWMLPSFGFPADEVGSALAFITAPHPAPTGASPTPRTPTGVSGSGKSSAAKLKIGGASRMVGGLLW